VEVFAHLGLSELNLLSASYLQVDAGIQIIQMGGGHSHSHAFLLYRRGGSWGLKFRSRWRMTYTTYGMLLPSAPPPPPLPPPGPPGAGGHGVLHKQGPGRGRGHAARRTCLRGAPLPHPNNALLVTRPTAKKQEGAHRERPGQHRGRGRGSACCLCPPRGGGSVAAGASSAFC
jgi:hypothetical protein